LQGTLSKKKKENKQKKKTEERLSSQVRGKNLFTKTTASLGTSGAEMRQQMVPNRWGKLYARK